MLARPLALLPERAEGVAGRRCPPGPRHPKEIAVPTPENSNDVGQTSISRELARLEDLMRR
jgi:hypothetical protein